MKKRLCVEFYWWGITIDPREAITDWRLLKAIRSTKLVLLILILAILNGTNWVLNE